MEDAGIDREEWPARLVAKLLRKELSCYTTSVPREAAMVYSKLRKELLKALGMSIEKCQKEFWTYRKTLSDTWLETARSLEYIMKRMTEGWTTIQEVASLLTYKKVLSSFPR